MPRVPERREELIDRRALEDAKSVRFSAAQEKQFEADTAAERCRMLVERGLLGLALYVAYLGIDWLLTPDVLGLAVILRVGFAAPLALVAILVVRSNPPVMVREGLMGLAVVLAGFAGLVVIGASQSVLRDHQHTNYILLALYVVVVLQLRFPYALATCLALFGLEAVAIVDGSSFSLATAVTDLFTFVAVTVLCLVAANSFDRYMRAAYLLGRRQYQRTASLEDLSRHDPLTGLGNRRALEDALNALGEESTDQPYAIVVADIDHFKSYNDSLGHQAGDICLKRIAGLLLAELRGDADRAIRYGGEEFVIFLPATDLATAQIIAERMRRNIADSRIPHPGRSTGVVTASFGVAAAPWGISADETIGAADAALYAAKNAGRNQVWPRLRQAADETRRAESA
ncbi:MAG: GGDEF domain-containing protein [Devosia sp.]|nr:GGDEF domain-containing protein [Devosia sp.]